MPRLRMGRIWGAADSTLLLATLPDPGMAPEAGVIPIFWVEVGPENKALCARHSAMISPSVTRVPVSAAEQKQALLIYRAPIRCDECLSESEGTSERLP